MTEADVDQLDRLLAPEFTLTHMTGLVQQRRDWLQGIRDGQFVYHRAEERSVSVERTGGLAILTGRLVVNATVYGGRGTWRLQLRQTYRQQADEWLATDSVASTW